MMENSSEAKNIKKERKIPTDIQMDMVKKSYCLINSKSNMKMEPQAGTSHEKCSHYDEMSDPMMNIECKDIVDGIMEDPLDGSSKKKVSKHLPINLNVDEPEIKTEGDEDITLGKHFLDIDNDSHGSRTNNQVVTPTSNSDVEESNKPERKRKRRGKQLPKSAKAEPQSSNEQNQLDDGNKQISKYKKFECHVCHRMFTLKSNLKKHLRIHTGEKPYTCHICKKTFNHKSNLHRHILIHLDEETYTCDVCNKVFIGKFRLYDHRLIHTAIKTFSCTECNKSFRLKVDFVRHKRVHTGDKPHTCEFCNKSFAQKTNLVRHRRTHTGESAYSCGICNEPFTRKANLKIHIQTH